MPGIAPGANLIALQALTASGRGSGAGLEDALSWCIENAEKYNISVINMSLGFGDNETEPLEWFLTDELLALKQLGVTTVSAVAILIHNTKKRRRISEFRPIFDVGWCCVSF